MRIVNSTAGSGSPPAVSFEPGQKKRHPEGYLFSKRSCDQPRQEPGRYFTLVVVPSPAFPQRQPKRPEPEFWFHVATFPLLHRGASETVVPSTAAGVQGIAAAVTGTAVVLDTQ